MTDLVERLLDPNAAYTKQTDGDYDPSRYIRWLLAECKEAATELAALRERNALFSNTIAQQHAEIERLTKHLDLLAIGFDVPDGGRYIADWQSRIAKFKTAEARAETAERELEAANANHRTMASQLADMGRKLAGAREQIAQLTARLPEDTI